MEEQEEQPIPEVEVTAGDTVENPPEKPTQSIDASLQEIMRAIMENNNKNMESLKESLNNKIDETEKNNNKNIEPVSYTHLDVYKRQI